MQVKKHILFDNSGSAVPFEKTNNKGRKLKNDVPEYIIMHYTAGGSARSTINWFKNKDAEVSAHLVIGHDGSVTQMVNLDDKAWHAGRSTWKELSGLNSYSVGIEVVNWGKLIGEPGAWKSWTGVPIPDSRVIRAAHRNNPTTIESWETFDEAQFDTAIEAVRAIATAYDIPEENVLGHDDISPRRKSDPGPAWDMERFKARVFGRKDDAGADEEFEVTATSGLNLRQGPGIEHAKIKLLKHGTKVTLVEQEGLWWMVAVVSRGVEDDTGWVHSRWLAMT